MLVREGDLPGHPEQETPSHEFLVLRGGQSVGVSAWSSLMSLSAKPAHLMHFPLNVSAAELGEIMEVCFQVAAIQRIEALLPIQFAAGNIFTISCHLPMGFRVPKIKGVLRHGEVLAQDLPLFDGTGQPGPGKAKKRMYAGDGGWIQYALGKRFGCWLNAMMSPACSRSPAR